MVIGSFFRMHSSAERPRGIFSPWGILLFLPNIQLLKVLHTTLKQLQILLACDVLCNIVAASLSMAHLTVDTSIRACDTFDRHEGAVRVPVFVHGRNTVKVNVLGRNLSVCEKLVDPLLRSHETSLAVGYRVCVNTTELCACKPRGLVGNNL